MTARDELAALLDGGITPIGQDREWLARHGPAVLELIDAATDNTCGLKSWAAQVDAAVSRLTGDNE